MKLRFELFAHVLMKASILFSWEAEHSLLLVLLVFLTHKRRRVRRASRTQGLAKASILFACAVADHNHPAPGSKLAQKANGSRPFVEAPVHRSRKLLRSCHSYSHSHSHSPSSTCACACVCASASASASDFDAVLCGMLMTNKQLLS